MQTNLDATEKEEVLADAIKDFRKSNRGPLAWAVFHRRLAAAGFSPRFANETIGEINVEYIIP